MKAMVLAAGLGRRMRPLTDHTPKPLLNVGGKPLLQYHLEALAGAGVRDVVINTAYLGDQIQAFAGHGARWGLTIQYSEETEPLETGGAIHRALPLLGDEPFLLLNGDVYTDFPLASLTQRPLHPDALGRLLLVPNQPFHPEGDFGLTDSGHLTLQSPRLTFAGISLLRPGLIAHYPNRRDVFPLLEALLPALQAGQLEGLSYEGYWNDVGTPERLADVERTLTEPPAPTGALP